MSLARKHKDVAHRAATKIREYWNSRLVEFYRPTVKVDFETGIISSDMKNGWPPLRSA